jgi:hypothetical protein
MLKISTALSAGKHCHDDVDNMLLCSTCSTGNDTHCLGILGVPDGDCYCSEGCKQLALLQPGCSMVAEAPQLLYANAKQPHLSLAMFCNCIISMSDSNLADSNLAESGASST